jgi:hypothetical protein
MTLTTLALVGAAAASFFPEHPYVAFAAGFASHFALDAMPHWDYTLRSVVKLPGNKLATAMRWGRDFWYDLARIGADALLGLVLTFVLASILHIRPEVALVGAGAGLYPDLLQFVYWKTHSAFLEPLQQYHVNLQKNIYPHWSVGMAYQAIVVAAVALGVVLTRV